MTRRASYAREVLVYTVVAVVAVGLSYATGHDWMPGLPIGVLLGLGAVTVLSLRDKRRAEQSSGARRQ
ncbi:hypothetical protein [Kineococcus esterisolvens]|uniref:hypothetical protein n=1 Tax=unclassified Kineococcus TaxID=2621656 RepID=UPI003D7E2E16